MKKTLLFILSITFVSCQNEDLEIIVEKNDCGCIQEVFTQFPTLYDTYCYEKFQDCNKIISDSEVLVKLQNTNPVIVKNFSRTNVYEILIQKDVGGSVSYQVYNLEPTSMFYIGCTRQFDVEIRSQTFNGLGQGNLTCEDQVQISEMTNVEVKYKIHKIEKLKEY
ncbi:hypothetical protein [Salinimicrobium sp. GXAS 041]|uniref:hypothetical protein n=1 Tax=Salinimicrobium sp. GXAS 041 TaxID=3400806 RepID=UPI003C790A04